MPSNLPIALDLNHDGVPEWGSDTQVIAWDGRQFAIAFDVTPSDYDCHC